MRCDVLFRKSVWLLSRLKLVLHSFIAMIAFPNFQLLIHHNQHISAQSVCFVSIPAFRAISIFFRKKSFLAFLIDTTYIWCDVHIYFFTDSMGKLRKQNKSLKVLKCVRIEMCFWHWNNSLAFVEFDLKKKLREYYEVAFPTPFLSDSVSFISLDVREVENFLDGLNHLTLSFAWCCLCTSISINIILWIIQVLSGWIKGCRCALNFNIFLAMVEVTK